MITGINSEDRLVQEDVAPGALLARDGQPGVSYRVDERRSVGTQ